MRLSNLCQLFYAIKFTPFFFFLQTAGFGVFAGRAFNKDEVVIWSWMTLLLPKNLPRGLSIIYYGFSHNKTHAALPLDYGSLFNHHKNANTHPWLGPNNNLHFQVRVGFSSRSANQNVLKICTYT